MEKKNKYLKLCIDPELEKEARNVQKRAIIFSIVFSVAAIGVIGAMVAFLI